MDVLQKLKELSAYHVSTRQVGHTTAMLEGAKNTDGIIILAHNMDFARQLAKQCPDAIPISWQEDGLLSLRGMRRPLLIDNAAIWSILSEAAKEIQSLQAEIMKLKELGNKRRKALWMAGPMALYFSIYGNGVLDNSA